MSSKIMFLPKAREDLREIADYYAAEFSASSARKIVQTIKKAIERLEIFPDSGASTPDEILNQQGYRMVVSGDYAAIYRSINGKIYIYRILNTHRDYPSLIFE